MSVVAADDSLPQSLGSALQLHSCPLITSVLQDTHFCSSTRAVRRFQPVRLIHTPTNGTTERGKAEVWCTERLAAL